MAVVVAKDRQGFVCKFYLHTTFGIVKHFLEIFFFTLLTPAVSPGKPSSESIALHGQPPVQTSLQGSKSPLSRGRIFETIEPHRLDDCLPHRWKTRHW